MELIELIDKHLTKDASEGKIRDYFHLSELGRSKKEIYESLKGKAFKVDAKGRRVFDNGDYVHNRYFKYFAEMGILIAAELTVVENDLFHGRCDCIITDKKELWVVEIKSCSQWSFQKLNDAQHDHKLQLQFYMYYLNIPRGIMLYECKDNQMIKTFKMELDKGLVESYIEEFKKLKEEISKGIIPDDKPIKLEDLQYTNGI